MGQAHECAPLLAYAPTAFTSPVLPIGPKWATWQVHLTAGALTSRHRLTRGEVKADCFRAEDETVPCGGGS